MIDKLQPGHYDGVFARRAGAPLDSHVCRMEYGAGHTVGSVLDLGCGMGLLADEINDRPYLGVDFSSVAIEWSRANIRNPNAQFLQADLRELIDIDSYDTVAMFEFLEHLVDPMPVAKLALQLAKQRVIVSVPVNMVGPAHVKGRWERGDLVALFGPDVVTWTWACPKHKIGSMLFGLVEL